MAQFARPDSDISTGSWTGSYTAIDEVTASDADFITSDDNTSPDTFECGLSNVTDPVSSTGHIVRWRWRKEATGGHTINPVVRLMQGATTIASKTVAAFDTATFTDDSFTLSGAEADSITDYTDLRLQFERAGDTGGSPSGRRFLEVSWAELEVPNVPTGTRRIFMIS